MSSFYSAAAWKSDKGCGAQTKVSVGLRPSLEALGENPFPCIFSLREATCISDSWSFLSIFKALQTHYPVSPLLPAPSKSTQERKSLKIFSGVLSDDTKEEARILS